MSQFHIYSKNRTLYSTIIQHSQASESTLDQFLNGIENADILLEDSNLDLLHLLLKHGRSCTSLDECTVPMKYNDVYAIVISKVSGYVKKPFDIPYPLLVCMIDLLKNDVARLDAVTLEQFLAIACTLWNHPTIYHCRKSMELCTLIVPLVSNKDVVLQAILRYSQLCRQYIRPEDLVRFKSPEYTEFFSHPQTQFLFDRVTLKLFIELVLCTCFKQDSKYVIDIQKEAADVCRWYRPEQIKDVLFTIYCVNDDDAIHLLNTVLTLYQQGDSCQLLDSLHLNPHGLFLFFLDQCGNTHDIVIDLLLENDSDFLSYFHRYIIYATQDIHCFLQEARERLDTFQTIVANTLRVLEGDGFPYNTKPLIRRLVQLEKKLYL